MYRLVYGRVYIYLYIYIYTYVYIYIYIYTYGQVLTRWPFFQKRRSTGQGETGTLESKVFCEHKSNNNINNHEQAQLKIPKPTKTT